MDKIMKYFSFLLFLAIKSYALDAISPVKYYDMESIILEEMYSQPNYNPGIDFLNLYNLSTDGQYIACLIGSYQEIGFYMTETEEMHLKKTQIITIDRYSDQISDVTSPLSTQTIGNMAFDKDEALWPDGSNIQLENSYLPIQQLGEEVEDTQEYAIKTLAINHKNNCIAGLIRWSTVGFETRYWFLEYTLNFWDSKSGNLITNSKIQDSYKRFRYFTEITKMQFSKSDKFLVFNSTDHWVIHKGSMNGGTIESEYFYLNSLSFLVDTRDITYYKANRDVAFTSDDHYYVTERDGLPSLVDAATHEVLQRYDPGATMSACCFSPDDKILYMACDDLKIYQFDSHLPSSAAMNWELLE